MTTKENKTEIRELSAWNMPDKVSKPDGCYRKTLPEATADNMQIMMYKINELVQTVNKLTEANKHLIDALKQFYLLLIAFVVVAKRTEMKVRLTIEIDLDKNLINFSDDEERMWVENEILVGNRELIVHSNEIGDYVGEVTSVKRLTWLDADNE